jgi:hypothetical protein
MGPAFDLGQNRLQSLFVNNQPVFVNSSFCPKQEAAPPPYIDSPLFFSRLNLKNKNTHLQDKPA